MEVFGTLGEYEQKRRESERAARSIAGGLYENSAKECCAGGAASDPAYAVKGDIDSPQRWGVLRRIDEALGVAHAAERRARAARVAMEVFQKYPGLAELFDALNEF